MTESAGTSRESCRAQGHNKRDTIYNKRQRTRPHSLLRAIVNRSRVLYVSQSNIFLNELLSRSWKTRLSLEFHNQMIKR